MYEDTHLDDYGDQPDPMDGFDGDDYEPDDEGEESEEPTMGEIMASTTVEAMNRSTSAAAW